MSFIFIVPQELVTVDNERKPPIVLSADNEIAHLTGALEHHKELASLSTRGEQVLVPSGHNIHFEHPEVVAEAILNLVNTVRRGI